MIYFAYVVAARAHESDKKRVRLRGEEFDELD